jgi:hypothetical protein
VSKPNADKQIIMDGLKQEKLENRTLDSSYYQPLCTAAAGNHQSQQADKQKREKYCGCSQILNLGV